jgi:hypothetical protein
LPRCHTENNDPAVEAIIEDEMRQEQIRWTMAGLHQVKAKKL